MRSFYWDDCPFDICSTRKSERCIQRWGIHQGLGAMEQGRGAAEQTSDPREGCDDTEPKVEGLIYTRGQSAPLATLLGSRDGVTRPKA